MEGCSGALQHSHRDLSAVAVLWDRGHPVAGRLRESRVDAGVSRPDCDCFCAQRRGDVITACSVACGLYQAADCAEWIRSALATGDVRALPNAGQCGGDLFFAWPE